MRSQKKLSRIALCLTSMISLLAMLLLAGNTSATSSTNVAGNGKHLNVAILGEDGLQKVQSCHHNFGRIEITNTVSRSVEVLRSSS